MKKCEDIRELISDYIDGDMAGDLLSEFEEHISSCEECRKELDDVKSIIAMLNDTPDEDLPLNFKDELHERLLDEKAKKKNVISLIITKYSHVFASAAGLLIIFSIWMVYNNNMGLKDGSPDISSIQSYESNEYGTREFKNDGSLEFGNAGENPNLRSYSGDVNNKSEADVGIQQAQEQDTVNISDSVDISAGKYDIAIDASNPNMKNRSQEKIDSKASDHINTEKQEVTIGSDDNNITLSMASIAPVPDENLYKSADFTVNTKDTSSGINSIRSIVSSLGGEELSSIVKVTGTGANEGVLSSIPDNMPGETWNNESLNFKIPANEYQLFCQKVNEIFGQSNVIINDAIVSEYESRKKEIQARV